MYFPQGLTASAETGCGKSTLLLSHLSKDHLVFTLDAGDSKDKVTQSDLFKPDFVTFVLGPSQITLRHYTWEKKRDFILIDGAHGYPFTDLDYYFMYPQINRGGLLALDDVHIPTITNLFNFLCEDDMFRLIALEGYTAFFLRTDKDTFDPHGDNWWTQKYNQHRFPHKDWLEPILGEKWWLTKT